MLRVSKEEGRSSRIYALMRQRAYWAFAAGFLLRELSALTPPIRTKLFSELQRHLDQTGQRIHRMPASKKMRFKKGTS